MDPKKEDTPESGGAASDDGDTNNKKAADQINDAQNNKAAAAADDDDLYDQQQETDEAKIAKQSESFKIGAHFDGVVLNARIRAQQEQQNSIGNPADYEYELERALDNVIQEASFELPKSLIITNMDSRIFDATSQQRADFEQRFQHLDPGVKLFYFKSFRRARADFTNNQLATKARIILNQVKFGDQPINCYFAEVAEAPANEFLKPPALEKQFLISPPASPPEGWEPCEEAQPIMNIDLQSALANLVPGTTHELHPPSTDQPGIVVHTCPDGVSGPTIDQSEEANKNVDGDGDGDQADDGGMMINRMVKTKIAHTPCPPSMQKLRQNEL